MSSPNIKPVLRTALIGISPADQVLIKGYLRLLLRIEADLEWVAANHPSIDLILISREFRKAASIKKLLEKNPTVPRLYCGRAENDQGGLTGDYLTIPIQGLNNLNTWLFNKVEVLGGSYQAETVSPDQSQPSKQTTDNNNQGVNSQQAILPKKEPVVAKQTGKPTPQKIKNNTVPTELVRLIVGLHSKDSTAYQIIVDNKVIADAFPKEGMVWADNHMNPPLPEWHLKTCFQSVQSFDATKGKDLKNWLWTIAAKEKRLAQLLIDPERRYGLAYWPKPHKDSDRRDVLRMLSALELNDLTPQQLAEKANVDIQTAMLCLVGLLISGHLENSVYIELEQLVKQTTKESVVVVKSETVSEDNSPAKSSDNNIQDQVLDNLSDENTYSETSTVISQDVKPDQQYDNNSNNDNTAAVATAVPPTESKPKAAKGFLARLREKLGL